MDELTKSLEDYLETILILENKEGGARVTSIAKRLNVKKPAVTSALRMLSDKKFVIYTPYKVVKLTDEGRKLAESVLKRHQVITKFFVELLNIPENVAENDACKIEHVISEYTFNRLSCFLKFIMESDVKCINIDKFNKEYCK
ncbi:MAG: metal-dependent transcriptional regulator [Calditerrivibrio sp.]|nr:metal-dependent transcriptional regulator [Calditerrivibrio sp.]MCA1932653.1 metal-dependent transcriptional regulator [Calditerrivibrio sp.]MCA1980273.1 metal-dependent transcriptional regulator [Calditerrivibrio sp.]